MAKKKPRPLPHSRGETDEKSAYRYQSTLRAWEGAPRRGGYTRTELSDSVTLISRS